MRPSNAFRRVTRMAIEIRNPSEDELRRAMKAVEAAFGEEQKEEDLDRHQRAMPRDRFLVAYEGVLPSHRRRGILTQMMKRQLEDLRERDEPLAILWASEAAIYGRFGYGIAAPTVQLDADRSRFSFRDDPGPRGAVRLIDRDEAAKVLPALYDEVRRQVPAFTSRRSQL